MKMMIVPIVIGAFGTVTKGLLKGLEDVEVGRWSGDHPTTTLLKRRILKTLGDLLSFKPQGKTLS